MEKLSKGRNAYQQVPQKSMYKPHHQFRRLNFSKEIETANFEVPFKPFNKRTRTNKYSFKTLTRWLLRSFISNKSLESKISLLIPFAFELLNSDDQQQCTFNLLYCYSVTS